MLGLMSPCSRDWFLQVGFGFSQWCCTQTQDPDLPDEDEDAYEEGGPDEAAGEAEVDPATLLDRFRSLTGQADPGAGSSETPAANEEYLGADAVPMPTEQQMAELEAEVAPPRPEQPSEEPIFQVIEIDDDEEEPEATPTKVTLPPSKVTWTSMPKDSFLDARVVMCA